MLKFVGKRILWLVPVILGVTFFVFTIMYFTPGDPVKIMLGAKCHRRTDRTENRRTRT